MMSKAWKDELQHTGGQQAAPAFERHTRRCPANRTPDKCIAEKSYSGDTSPVLWKCPAENHPVCKYCFDTALVRVRPDGPAGSTFALACLAPGTREGCQQGFSQVALLGSKPPTQSNNERGAGWALPR